MPSFQDSIFLFILALLLFGPKQLPKLARELGKWMGEFRRASNDFKMQMEDELRQTEQAEHRKRIEAMEAAAPPQAIPEPEHPHLPASIEDNYYPQTSDTQTDIVAEAAPAPEVLPIAVSGDLSIMPPSTGLPTARTNTNPLGGLIESIPAIEDKDTAHSHIAETHSEESTNA